jgi:propionaldehyde dehydrogenase
VDETADLQKAAADIINGCTFDNNLPCIAEKAIVAVGSIADKLMRHMVNEQQCYRASDTELARLKSLVLGAKGLNRDCVGRSADALLKMAGINAPQGTRCIVFEGEKEHPLIAEELMMPILGMVRAANFDEGVQTALWLERGYRHSAHIHSKNIDRITTYAKALDTAILVRCIMSDNLCIR